MSKLSTVVALVLFVLSGAIGLRNIVSANLTTMSASSASVWSHGPGPIPQVGGSHQLSHGPGPIPTIWTR